MINYNDIYEGMISTLCGDVIMIDTILSVYHDKDTSVNKNVVRTVRHNKVVDVGGVVST